MVPADATHPEERVAHDDKRRCDSNGHRDNKGIHLRPHPPEGLPGTGRHLHKVGATTGAMLLCVSVYRMIALTALRSANQGLCSNSWPGQVYVMASYRCTLPCWKKRVSSLIKWQLASKGSRLQPALLGCQSAVCQSSELPSWHVLSQPGTVLPDEHTR